MDSSNMDSSNMDSPTCRVCRSEATDDHPLFHPCHCRGSMKFIHQDCLEFWLQHSNNHSCDICHTPFRFNIIYNDSTPNTPPLTYILAQIFSYFIKFQYIIVKSILALFAILQTFYSFSLLNSLIDILLGVKLTPPTLLPTSFQIFLSRFTSGALSATIYALLTLAMVLIQNSFIIDHGFQKIIDTHIGRAPPTSERIHDLINQLQQINRQQQQQQQQQPTNTVIAQSYANSGIPDPNASLTIEQLTTLRDFALENASIVNSPYSDHIDEAIHNVITFSPQDHHSDQTRLNSFRQAERTIREALIERELPPPPPPQLQRPLQPPPQPQPQAAPVPAPPPPPPQQEEELQPQNLNPFSNKNTIPFIIQVNFVANVASLALLILHKFFPSVITSLAFPLIAKLLSPLTKHYPLVIIAINSHLPNITLPLPLQLTTSFIHNNIFTPITTAISNITNNTPTDSTFERIFAQLSGITIIITVMYVIMWKLERSCSQQNPLTGTYRTIYISLLQFVSVFKVLTLLLIEWLLFPLFAGSQVEFALVPIFNDNLLTYQLEPQPFNHLLPRLLIKWFIGTFFMYYFASFVSLLRNKILRKGVMFFIRPSDDPNVQIVHDAIMRPFLLRLSRIALSAAVYSLYITIQFTIPAWSIRLLTPILPFHNTFITRYIYASFFILSKFMEPFFIKYWSKALELGCKLTKLSHFLLDKDIPSERSTNGYFMRAPADDHVSRKFVRTLFYPVTEKDTLIQPIPPIPDDEAYYNPYGDVDPLEIDIYTVVYRPPHFKLRLIILFILLELASYLYTALLYIANICIGKLILNITHISNILNIPREFYKVDIYSLFITLAILSQLPQFISNNNTLRSQLTSLTQSKPFIFILNRAESLLQLTAYLHASNYALGSYIITNNSTLLIIAALMSLPPITASLTNSTNKRTFTALSILILTTRILSILTLDEKTPNSEVISQLKTANSVQELIEISHKNGVQPDTYITTRIVSLFLPDVFTRIFYIVQFAPYESKESLFYFIVWGLLASWLGLNYLHRGWIALSEHTRERYFANSKILANVDD
ncbi:hypothetical protein CANINC_002707 [Pichia inconspicua]|uniref:RING-type E3 ubiquitin transferase n=1 Tax=Pichia inconspicua TaxID=52247 RepID=A0A4T0X223_9ASCO|nr:hypothetical protein CANINC_002707 [[Candida] inconspicua]